jgi:dipeptidyl aminopeptidase/acylaminoacyl peptidase
VAIRDEDWNENRSVYLMNPDGSGKCLLAENASISFSGYAHIEYNDTTEGDTNRLPPLDLPRCSAKIEETQPVGAFVTVEVGEAFLNDPVSGAHIQLTTRTTGTAEWVALSPDGSTVAVTMLDDQYHSSLYLIDVESLQPQLVDLGGEPDDSLAWSPDGTQLLLPVRTSEKQHAGELVSLNIKTSVQTVLFVNEDSPAASGIGTSIWSPAGDQIVFSAWGPNDSPEANDGGFQPRLFSIRPDGTGLREYDTPPMESLIIWRPNT